MTNQQAIECVQERISLLVSNPKMQQLLIDMKMGGSSDEECQSFISKMAIATLVQ